jgi:hypothetical protein
MRFLRKSGRKSSDEASSCFLWIDNDVRHATSG